MAEYATATTVGSDANSSPLLTLLNADDIVPGSPPSYELCKLIFTYHPLGAKMAESPIILAQSQEREIQVPAGPEEELKDAFRKEWKKLNADIVIRNTMRTSRIYGISSVVMKAREDKSELKAEDPIPLEDLWKYDLAFNVIDPLNTAGSLVLSQDPNDFDFQKPKRIRVANVEYHPSRSVTIFNEQPVYISFTDSAFGFVGRSVYQRALYPLKSYVKAMIMDNSVMEKAALIIWKTKSPGSILDKVTQAFYALKRNVLKGATTGNVVTVGVDDVVESLDLLHLKDAAEFSLNNIKINIAVSANMPAVMINEETFAEGFGEGTEDAKKVAKFIDSVRIEMDVLYQWFDMIAMHRAWNPEFYESMQRKYPKQYREVPYETAFYKWKNSFKAVWPNLLAEPDSEKAQTEDVIMKAAIGIFEVLAPVLDPENKAVAAAWLADVANDRKLLFSSPLEIDEQAMAEYEPPKPEFGKEPKPIVESGHV